MERRTRLLTLTLIPVLLCSAASSEAQHWRGIRPLHSTRDEVERLIGQPMERNSGIYALQGERVNISYSDTQCTKGWPYGWDVPVGTVTAITVFPQPKPKLADLAVDISKSKKYVDPSGVIHYNNDDVGFSVAVDPKDYEVEVIEYYPAANDAELRCPEAAAREREIANGTSAVRSPDVYYSDKSPEKKEVYLDYLADQLQKAPPESTVYIIGYAGQRAKVREAEVRANVAKQYLIAKRGIDSKRIVTIDGGHRDLPGVDLFITLRDQPKPLASPSVYPGNVQIVKNDNPSSSRFRKQN